MYHHIQLEIELPIARLIVQRAERRNAISALTIDELARALDELERLSDLRCLLFTGGPGEVFLSGGDLKEYRSLRTHEEALAMNRRMGRVLRRLEQLECPVLMVINGVTIGGGCEVMLAGDRRLMAEEATLSFRQAILGLTCGWGGMSRLERLVGRSRALQILLLEEVIPAHRALELGIVDEVVERSQLMERSERQARTLAALPPLALKAVKRGLLRVGEMPFEQALDYEAELFARTWASSDHWEAVDAFFNHRPPSFTGQ